jgi:DNA transformation protein and related proteins
VVKRTQFVEFVLEQLSPLGSAQAKSMFGGFGIYVNGLFCAIVHRDILYLKANERSSREFEAIGAQPFKPFPHKPMMMRYYEINAEILENRESLHAWALKAMQAALQETRSDRGRKR